MKNIKTDFNNPNFRLLINAMDEEFNTRYPFLKNILKEFEALNESARVLVVLDGKRPVACGVFRPVTVTIVEIKRIYTITGYRNQGIGKQILRDLEKWAREEGFSEAILETGIRQPEAITACMKFGYTQIPNYPPYDQVKESVCFKKVI